VKVEGALGREGEYVASEGYGASQEHVCGWIMVIAPVVSV